MDTAELHWRPLGTLLVERGLLSAEELEDALEAQRETGKRLGEILVERGLVSHPALSDTLARQYGIELTSESGFGTGLRALIERRHAATRPNALPAPSGDESAEPEVETADVEDVLGAPGQLIALEPQLEEHWARLAGAEAKVAERDGRIEDLEHELAEQRASLATEIEVARTARKSAGGELETVRAERNQAQVSVESLREEVGRLQRERDAELVRGRQLRDEVGAVGQTLEQRQGELDALQAELDDERTRRYSSEQDRGALAAEVAEARAALAEATDHASQESRVDPAESDRAREEQRRTVEALTVVLDEMRRERDTLRHQHAEAERQVAALAARVVELEGERDDQARALVEAPAIAAVHEARVRDLEEELQRRLGELGSAHDERGKLAQLVNRLGNEHAARQRQLAEATEQADRQRRRAEELTEEAARQVEEEREERARLVPRLDELQREVAASEQRLAAAAIRVLGERRRQDEARRRAEAAEATARRYRHRLSELEQSGGVPA